MMEVHWPRWMPKFLMRWFIRRKLRAFGLNEAQIEALADAVINDDIPTRKGG